MAVATLAVRVAMQTAEVTKGFADLTRATEKAGKDFEGLATRAAAVGRTLATGLGLSIGVSALGSFGQSLLKNAGAITDFAQKTGLAMSTIQRFQFVAAQTGTTLDTFTNAAFKLGTNLAGGSGSVERAVTDLGLSFATLQRLRPDDQFVAIADALHKMVDPQERNRIALELFGRTAKELMPAISEGYSKLAASAKVASDDQIKALDDAADAWDRFKQNSITGATSWAGQIIIAFEKVDRKTNEWAESFDILRNRMVLSAQAAAQLPAMQREMREFALAQGGPALFQASGVPQLDADLTRLTTTTGGVVKSVALASDTLSDFAKKLKALKDQFSGRELVESAKAWAEALKVPGATAKALANEALRDDLLKAIADVERQFGSLERAGLGALTPMKNAADAAANAWKNLPIIVGFTVRQLETLQRLPMPEFSGYDPGKDPGHVPLFFLSGLSLNLFKVLTSDAQRELERIRRETFQQSSISYDPAKDPQHVPLFFLGGLSMAQLRQKMDEANHLNRSFIDGIDYSGITKVLDSVGRAFDNVFGRIASGAADVVHGIGNIVKATTKLDAISSVIDLGARLGQMLRPLLSLRRGRLGALLGTNKQGRDIVRAFAAEMGGFDTIQRRLEELGPSYAHLWRNLTQLPNNADTGAATRAVEEIQAALDAFGTEAERAERRLNALGSAIEGVNKKAELFAAPFRKLLESRGGTEGDEFDAITRKMQATAQAGQAEFERLGVFVGATFAGMVKETGDVFAAITALTPAFKVLQEGVDKFSLTSTGVIDQLLKTYGLINDAVTGPILQSIQATGQIFAGLQTAGYMTSDLFQTVGADIGAAFRDLEAKGGDIATAMALSQPVLQRLWEGQQLYGEITDDTTGKLLKQAEEQGLVGAHMKDVNQKILDVLLAIADVFGAKIPDALRGLPPKVKTAADAMRIQMEAAARGAEDAFKNINIRPIKIDIEYNDPGFVGSDGSLSVRKLASGGIVRRPTLALVGEAGPEAVIPLEQLGRSGRGGTGLNAEPRSIGPFTILIPPGELTRAMKDGTPIVVQAINDNHQGAHTQLFGRGEPLGVI